MQKGSVQMTGRWRMTRVYWWCNRAAALALVLCVLPGAHAQQAAQTTVNAEQLPTIVVTGTRIPLAAFDVPASITAVQIGNADADTPNINVSEYLRQVPGVLARDRQNYAQDQQISIRGFGSRSTFGVRGVRLYVDGIPATMPDGQGQVSNFAFDGASRIEVLRGPFSALYGNSSGGVIQIFTADGSVAPELRGSIGAGSDGVWRVDTGARGTNGSFGYNVDLSEFHTDGYRDHSSATRIIGNAKLDFKVGNDGKLTLLLNSVSLPEALDPQGLTQQQFDSDPRQASPSALTFNTRKSVHQAQGGALYTQQLGSGQSLNLLAYYGRRTVQQFLAVPASAQKNPLNSGGVIDLDTRYGGADVHWSWTGALAGRELNLTAGVAFDSAHQLRLGHENFVGATLGVVGALRRNEQDDVYNIDEYAQGTWHFAPLWSLTLGARHTVVRFSSQDHYITAINPDDSGRVAYGSTDPVGGLILDVRPDWHVYASYGRGFATPTFSEIGYRPGGSGLNFALQPSRSRTVEIGSKWLLDDGGKLDIALFQANTSDEAGVLSSSGGRTIYQNVGRSRRRGFEAGLRLPLGDAWALNVAYTYLDARFQDAFGACSRPAGCMVAAGARMPGVPRQLLNAGVRWGGTQGWHAGLQIDAAAAVSANDAGTIAAPGYVIAGVNAGYVLDTAGYQIVPFVRIDNLFDLKYIGSVIVDQANGGSFEPGPGRTFFAGVKVSLRRD
ncbi:MAG: TonB-dependent receptor [Lysobacteraceae bacterium]